MERSQDLTEQLLNLDITSPDFTLETYGLHSMALRFHLEGIAELADLDALKLDLVEPEEDE